VKSGFRQGNAFFKLLCNILLKEVLWNIQTCPNGIIFNKTHYLAYAGGVILGLSVRAIEEVLVQLKDNALRSGLELNANKTKCLRVMRNLPNFRKNFNVDGHVFEEANSFDKRDI
jgi:hypothetical protein